MTSETAMTLIRSALEGLARRSPLPVARHAHATRVAVTIEVAGGMLTAEVADDGVGARARAAGPA